MKRANRKSLVRDKAIVLPVVVALFFNIPALAGGEDNATIKASSAKWVTAFNAGDLPAMAVNAGNMGSRAHGNPVFFLFLPVAIAAGSFLAFGID